MRMQFHPTVRVLLLDEVGSAGVVAVLAPFGGSNGGPWSWRSLELSVLLVSGGTRGINVEFSSGGLSSHRPRWLGHSGYRIPRFASENGLWGRWSISGVSRGLSSGSDGI